MNAGPSSNGSPAGSEERLVRPFVFEATTFVAVGRETALGDWSSDVRAEIAKLRFLYPELSHWGDLAIGEAFGDMSEDVLSVSWAHWLLEERHEFFLDYCCWRQTRGPWEGKLGEELTTAIEWKAG